MLQNLEIVGVVVVEIEFGGASRRARRHHAEDRARRAFVDVARVQHFARWRKLDHKVLAAWVRCVSDDQITVKEERRADGAVERRSGEYEMRIRGVGSFESLAALLDDDAAGRNRAHIR